MKHANKETVPLQNNTSLSEMLTCLHGAN